MLLSIKLFGPVSYKSALMIYVFFMYLFSSRSIHTEEWYCCVEGCTEHVLNTTQRVWTEMLNKIISRISYLYVSQHGGPDCIPDVFLHNLFMRRFVTLIRGKFVVFISEISLCFVTGRYTVFRYTVFGCLSKYCYSLSKTVFIYINRVLINSCHICLFIHTYIHLV